jgi:lysophospholipase L1-like esterase
MTEVHSRFRGSPGTFAQFGDSMTISMAFWAPLAHQAKHLDPATAQALQLVNGYMNPACWQDWKGPGYGNKGSMGIRWALANVQRWLEKLNPEVAVILFGSNDLGRMGTSEYIQATRQLVQRCLDNGTVVLLTTVPPRSGRLDEAAGFAAGARRLAAELRVPLIDYFAEILRRRPDDWDGSLPQFADTPGDVYQVPTLISRDGVHPSNPAAYVGDYSPEGLRRNGYTLRNYLTLTGYAEVARRVLLPAEAIEHAGASRSLREPP